MIRFLKVLAAMVILGALGLIGYAYLGDLSPVRSEMRIPVDLDGE